MIAPSVTHDPIRIPWGDVESLELDLPGSRLACDVVWPDLSGIIVDYPEALSRALDVPRRADGIEDQVRVGSTVAIVVDDPSRWTPVQEALPIVLRRLHRAGVRNTDITISIGVGRHRAVDGQSMRKRIGNEVADAYRCYSPPVDDRSQYVDLGETAEGVPVRVFRPVAEADLRIMIGSVLPHLQAGFGGGFKLIFPGTCHRSTLGALHRLGLHGDAGRLLGGDAVDNPMRCAIRSAAGLLRGPCFSVSHLLGAPGQILRVLAGRPDCVQDELATEARGRFRAPKAAPADLVVVGNHPWPGDPLQSFKVLLNHRAAGRPGGVLVGFFWTDPQEIDRSLPSLLLKLVAASGVVGGWAIRRGLAFVDRAASACGNPSAFMVRWARELIVDRTVLVYAPCLHERVGSRLGPVRLFADQEQLWNATARALAGQRVPLVRIFPQGGLTYCPEPDVPTAPQDIPGISEGAEPLWQPGSLSAPGGFR